MTTDSLTPASPPAPPRGRRCTARTATGRLCRAWAVRTSDPPRCAAHGGGRAPVGAPPGNHNARTHGFYAASGSAATTPDPPCSIDDVIADLASKYNLISSYIDQHIDDLSPSIVLGHLKLHGQTASRLGRLLRDRHVIAPPQRDALSSAVNQALDELAIDLGVDL